LVSEKKKPVKKKGRSGSKRSREFKTHWEAGPPFIYQIRDTGDRKVRNPDGEVK